MKKLKPLLILLCILLFVGCSKNEVSPNRDLDSLVSLLKENLKQDKPFEVYLYSSHPINPDNYDIKVFNEQIYFNNYSLSMTGSNQTFDLNKYGLMRIEYASRLYNEPREIKRMEIYFDSK